VNHDGAARTLNKTAAANAICGYACQQWLYLDRRCDCKRCLDFKLRFGNGLDSGAVYLYGYGGARPSGSRRIHGAAFPGTNPNVGEGLFILPQGRT
jgi:hypothetical protein